MKKMKIIIIHHKISYGGANKMIVFLANKLINMDYEVDLYTYSSDEDSVYPLDSRINLIKEKKVNKFYLTRRFIQIIKVRKIIKKTEPNLVISFMTNNNLFSIIGTMFTNIPVIISERGDPNSEKGLLANIKRYFFIFAEGMVFQTEGAQSCYPPQNC